MDTGVKYHLVHRYKKLIQYYLLKTSGYYIYHKL